MDVLKIMSEALISDLIPTIGERAIFLNYWRKLLAKMNVIKAMIIMQIINK